jgi:mannosyltransferase OCH1-like enzyme
MYIDNLLPRNIYPIKNNIELIYSSNEDFHIVVYYEKINKIKIIIRRLDCNCGWNIDLRIKIFSLNSEDSEIISIGSYDENYKIMTCITRINIYKTDYLNQIIPKIIFQTTPNKDINNILHYNSILTFIELNPEYEYRILDNNDCRKFIKENFDSEILRAYDLLLAGSFKADLFRYCYLYINGGCYFDCKQILRKPIRQLIEPDEEMILCNDMNNVVDKQ